MLGNADFQLCQVVGFANNMLFCRVAQIEQLCARGESRPKFFNYGNLQSVMLAR
jgi:hypothetical protein